MVGARLPLGLVRAWKLEYYARQYRGGKLTLARAARDADMSLWGMMEYPRVRKAAAQYDLEDLRQDLETISGSTARVQR